MGWILGGIAGIIFLCLLCWRFGGKTAATYGSAAWLSLWDANKRKLFDRKGLLVGDWPGTRGLTVSYENTHAASFGYTGAGKGTCAILPNLLSCRHVFLIDPGGENTAIAAKSWQQAGVPFSVINLAGMFTQEPWQLPVHGFNVFDLLETGKPRFAQDAKLFAEMLTPRTGGEQGNSSFFKNASQADKHAFIIHVKTAESPARQNLSTLYEYVNADANAWEKLLDDMSANPACAGLVQKAANRIRRREAQAPEEFSAVMSTTQEDLEFLADPQVRSMLSRSDVDFSMLKNPGGGIISVVQPLEDVGVQDAISRLALGAAVLTMQRQPVAKNKVLFLIDEAAALGKIIRFPDWLATLRKYGCVFWSIWQNMSQVEALYGKSWETIISNCGLLQILSVGDQRTAEYTERMLGRCTVQSVTVNARGERSVSQTARPIVMADELRRMPANRQIAFIGNLQPALLAKTPYWKCGEFAGRFNPNPYHDGETPGPNVSDTFGALKAGIIRVLMFWLTPHPVAACIITGALFLFLLPLLLGGR